MKSNKTLTYLILTTTVLSAISVALTFRKPRESSQGEINFDNRPTSGLVGGSETEEESRYTGHYIDIDVNGDHEFDYTVAVCVPREGTDGTASMMVSRIEEDPRAMVEFFEVNYADVDSLRNQMEEQ
ncbi:MAG: hypothetical protein KKH88_04000 [Nanoarchaeota archaeon]|nr:hypothetical protein [Nanoarchaeota archaeon]